MKIVNSINSDIKPEYCELPSYKVSGCLYLIGNVRRCINCIFCNIDTKIYVLILITQSGDLEGLYIDDILIDEGHILGGSNNRLYLLKKSEEYGFKSTEVRIQYLNDEDEIYMVDAGNFPKNLNELKGTY